MNILVTGGTGFLGGHLVRVLRDGGHVVDWSDSRYDLRDANAASALMKWKRWDVVYHLAARVGGIGYNRRYPANLWRDNLLMGLNVLDACRETNAPKLVMVGTACSYPKRPQTIPFVEDELFDGYPEETNAAYGIAKRALIAGAAAYREQYGLNVVTAIPTNLYGPGDNFDPESSHVIPAMMRKFEAAKAAGRPTVELWGTGSASRDFLFVEDAAAALVKMAGYDGLEGPVNLGSGREVSISDLAEIMRGVVGYRGAIVWDDASPNGQPRRVLDCTRALKHLGWSAETALEDGLKKMYAWWVLQAHV